MDIDAFREDFLAQLQRPDELGLLFDHLPDVYFFVKNSVGQFVMGNSALVTKCGVSDESQMIGKTDHDFFPKERADGYVRDDRYVLQTGRRVVNRVELAAEPSGRANWFLTSKIPLRSHTGRIVGVAGTAKDYEPARSAISPYRELTRVTEFIETNYGDRIEVKRLAALASLSVSQFERTFRRVMRTSPVRYLHEVRIRAACRRLACTGDKIATIAQDTGFYDHSHFTRAFVEIMAITPRAYRRRVRGE
ncbi:MAG: AraC family transcriptional regulator [Kiritimatiellae bacterium]|nr:AraC family transcriptional regulator [Kiritimatiellia bacterium]